MTRVTIETILDVVLVDENDLIVSMAERFSLSAFSYKYLIHGLKKSDLFRLASLAWGFSERLTFLQM